MYYMYRTLYERELQKILIEKSNEKKGKSMRMGKRKKRNIQEKMKEETDKADKESKDDCKNMNNSKGTAEVIEKHKRETI